MRASFAASTSATVVVPRSLRLRAVVLLLRMCCLNALLRRNLPRLVRLKRFAAPRCVLIFCFGIVSCPHDQRRARGDRRAITLCALGGLCVGRRYVVVVAAFA